MLALIPWDGTNNLRMIQAAPEYLVATTMIFCACPVTPGRIRGRLQPVYTFDKVLSQDPSGSDHRLSKKRKKKSHILDYSYSPGSIRAAFQIQRDGQSLPSLSEQIPLLRGSDHETRAFRNEWSPRYMGCFLYRKNPLE
jgi:hypothetical protein